MVDGAEETGSKDPEPGVALCGWPHLATTLLSAISGAAWL
jgi:hypothetical protein